MRRQTSKGLLASNRVCAYGLRFSPLASGTNRRFSATAAANTYQTQLQLLNLNLGSILVRAEYLPIIVLNISGSVAEII